MLPGPARRVTADLDAMRFSCAPDPDRLAWAECLGCGGRLGLHQPDPDRPECLLGVCSACGRWHLASFDTSWAGGTLIGLPRSWEASRLAEGAPSDR